MNQSQNFTFFSRPNNFGLYFRLSLLALLGTAAIFLWQTTGDRQTFVAAGNSPAVSELLPTAPPMTNEAARAAYGKLPLSFEANQGQTDAAVNFTARGAGYSLFLKPTEAVFVLSRKKDEPAKHSDERLTKKKSSNAIKSKSAMLRMKLKGANPLAIAEGKQEQTATVNYFIGSDSSKWQTGISTFGRVNYKEVYPGIDVTYYGNQKQLEYDFIVAPNVDYKRIKLEFEGAKRIEIERSSGDLLLHTRLGTMREHQPVVYQEKYGERREITSRFVKRGKEIGFEIGAYDRTLPLIIDPTLAYSTYLGGSDYEFAADIAVDSSGSAYVTGETDSVDFPTQNPFQANNGGFEDAYVTKLSANGQLVYSTYLGGNGDYDIGYGIAVDSSGCAYIAGDTDSSNFPTRNAFQANFGGNSDAFVTKLSANGQTLVYSTYLGYDSSDYALDIAIDASGNAYVTGKAGSTFPTQNPFQANHDDGDFGDAFVTKLSANGQTLVFSTYLGGSGIETAYGIAVDSSGYSYVTGYTGSRNFPTRNPFQASHAGDSFDVFVTKFSPDGQTLVYSTYLGGSGDDIGNGIAADSSGNAYVTGDVNSGNFPVQNAFQATQSGVDGFVTKLSANGQTLIFSTYLGGSGSDNGEDIAIDASGNVYIVGETQSLDFPTQNPFQTNYGGGLFGDAFVTKLSANGQSLVYSTYLGGSETDYGNGIAVDASGNAYVTGVTDSPNFPTRNPFQASRSGADRVDDAFVAKLGNPPTTAAAVSVSGRVTTSSERGLAKAIVLLTDASGNMRTTATDSFGYYNFAGVPAGGTYIFSVKAKRYQFGQPSQVLSVNEDQKDVNFTAFPEERGFH